jgi:hypothetical protein
MRDFETKLDNTSPASTGILDAATDNVRFNELKNAVSTADITLDPSNGPDTAPNKLAQAIARYASGAIYMQDTGAANTYVLATPGTFITPKAYFNGMRVGFLPGATNTGNSNINAGAVGSRKLLRMDGSELSPGDVVANAYTEAVFLEALDGGTGGFAIPSWGLGGAGSGTFGNGSVI